MLCSRNDLNRFLKKEECIYRGNISQLKWYFLLLVPFTIHESQFLYKYIRLLRKAEFHSNNKNLLCYFYKIRLRYLQYKYGLSIPMNVFDIGLKIQHLAQTRVSSSCKIGKNCTIYPFVSIGTNQNASPILGDNVTIFSGARIIGGVTLADNIMVAANAVVTKSCNIPGAVLAGIPAKVIKVNALTTS